MKDYFRRSQDVINAVRSLTRSGLSVSLPYRTVNGEMFFEIDGYVLSVAQILELLDKNGLDRVSIRQFGARLRTMTG